MDLWSTGHGFDSQPFHVHVTTLGKLFTHMCLFVTKQYNLIPTNHLWADCVETGINLLYCTEFLKFLRRISVGPSLSVLTLYIYCISISPYFVCLMMYSRILVIHFSSPV